MKVPVIFLAALMVAFACTCAAVPTVGPEEEEGGVGSTIRHYWDIATDQLSKWLQDAAESNAGQYLSSKFNGSTSALATYGKVLFDQITHMV